MSAKLSINRTLAGKAILITGSTGFVGKVLVEKILRSCPEVGKIYLLIRGDAQQRIQTELLQSQAFQVCESSHGSNFLAWANSKLVGINGDIQQKGLGLSQSDMKLLQDNVNLVVHCAASVDFKARLDIAVKQNVLGTLALFELAKSFRHLQAFVHVSTAYVNSDKPGFHAEELPVLHFDPEEMVQLVLQMDERDIEKQTNRLIGKFPNTYTFTKAMAERILERRRGNIPLSLVRPSIIGSAWREPVPGWIDSVNAIGAMVLFTGVGLVDIIQGHRAGIADVVPVDYVINAILGALAATVGRNSLAVYHATTSQLNPVYWGEAERWVPAYWRQHNVQQKVSNRGRNFAIRENPLVYQADFLLRYELPTRLFSMFANTLGNANHRKQANLMRKITERTAQAADAFSYFTSTEFIFSAKNSAEIMSSLIEEEKELYPFDISEMDWEKYFRYFCYGVQRYVLREDVKPPTDLLKVDLVNEPRKIESQSELFAKVFPDLSWAFKEYRTSIGIDNLNTLRTPEETKHMILKSKRIKSAIKKKAKDEGSTINQVEKQAAEILDRMSHNFNLQIVRMVGWFLRKTFKKIYEGIHIDENGVEAVREVLTKGPLVLVPTHRSYVDFLIISYICFEFDLPLPRIAAGEDFLGVMFVNWIFRHAGAFFLRRSFKEDSLYIALFTEYVQRLLVDWNPIEFFIEGKRSRTGKSLHPKRGLLSICMEPFLEKKIPDLNIVPISISYEKVIEAELYSNELLGEAKVKESFSGLVRASKILTYEFGRINVIFNPPISLKEYTENLTKQVESGAFIGTAPVIDNNDNNNNNSVVSRTNSNRRFNPFSSEEDRKLLTSELAYQIVGDLNRGIVVTTTALVATVILTYRKGITHDDLLSKVEWLREAVVSHGSSVAFEGSTEDLIKYSLRLLSSVVEKVRNTYVPTTSPETGKQHQSILILDFYRNQLLHLFVPEGIIACVLSAYQTPPNGMKREDLIQEATFLRQLLWMEFVNKATPQQEVDMGVVIDSMIERGLLTYSGKGGDQLVVICEPSAGQLAFLCHLFWPLIDAYWVTLVSFFTIQPSVVLKKRLQLQRIQWIAEKMHAESHLQFYESCSMETILNAFDLFHSWKVVEYLHEGANNPLPGSKRGKSRRQERKNPLPDPTEICLSPSFRKESDLQQLVEHVNKFRKTPPPPHFNQLGFKRAIITEYPVLAKL